LTWKAGIDYDVTKENLLYATVSTGFKSGGLNNLPADVGLTTYAPEEITAYELGSKNRFVDDRVQVNLSVFRYDYKNYQTFVFYQPTGGPNAGSTLFPTVNSQTATFEGGELSSEFALSTADRVGLSLSYLHNVYKEFVIALPYVPVNDLSGTDVPLSPRLAAVLSYQHVFQLGAAGNLTLGADAHYFDSYIVTGTQGNFADNATYTQPSYTKYNANLSWRTGTWTVSAFGRNLSNKATINTVAGGYPVIDNFFLINAMVDPPRTYGVAVQKDF
jgi:iron complex outermembrane receptor protein